MSWRAKLSAGNTEAAWDEFITRYRRLILATIRRTLGDDDDVVDVFAEALTEAQRILLRDPRTARPFFWAGFVINGGAANH